MEDLTILKNEEEFKSLERPKNIKKVFYLCVCPQCGKQSKRSYTKILHDKNAFLCMRCHTENTLQEKYGDPHYVGYRNPDEWKKKVKQTMQNKYGVENAGQMSDHKERIKNSLINNFGSLENAFKKRQIKSNKTRIEKYGSLENSYQKGIETFKKHYGVENASQLKSWKYTHTKKVNEKYSQLFSDRGDFYEKDGEFFFKCKKCGNIHKQTNKDMWRRCLVCFPINKNPHFSEEQNEVAEFLKQFTDVKQNQKSVFKENGRLELDIVTSKFAIEYDGSYWHNNHKDTKKDLCDKYNINLIRIYDFEWQDKKDIVKSILKSKLGIFDKKLYARKCTIKEISSKEYNDFCNKNHLQGSGKASVKIGLFYNNELVEIMSFGKPRFSKIYDYEMIRECSKLGYFIVGGKSRLLKYFERNYNPKSIISYCDRRYFDGHSYTSIGFTFEKTTNPAFSVYDGCELKSRMNYTKPKMQKMNNFKYFENLSQIDNIIENNLIVLWDNGTNVYVKNY